MDHSYHVSFFFLAIFSIALSPPRKKPKTTNAPIDSNEFNLDEFDFYISSPIPNFAELPLPERTVDSTNSFSQEPDSFFTNNAVEDGFDLQQFCDNLLESHGMLEQSTDQSNENINNDNDIADDNNVAATKGLGDDNGDSDDVNGAHSHCPSKTARLQVIDRAWDVNGVDFDVGGPSSATAALTQTVLCKCNNMLREIVHTTVGETRRLHLYGKIGSVSHAILSIQLFSSDGKEYSYQEPPVDMRGYTLQRVKKYIEDYCTEREAKDLMRVEDTNADFYQAMSASSIFNLPARHMVPLTSLIQVPISGDQPHVELRDEPTLSAERQTPPKLGVSDLISLFHLPIKEAAENIKMNETTLRNISRQHGVIRWPSRRVNANRAKIARCKAKLREAQDSEAKESAESEIEDLQKESDKIVSDTFKGQ